MLNVFWQLYGDYENVPFLPNDRRCGNSGSWCYYFPWTWPSYTTPMWRTWWHADVWKQSKEKPFDGGGVSWFQPTDGLWYVWKVSIAHNWTTKLGIKPREQNFHYLNFINSTLVDVVYKDTTFTNLSLVNTSCINSTFINMTAFSSNLVNVTFYNVSFVNFTMRGYTAINVTEIMTTKVNGSLSNCTFINATFVASTHLNCTFNNTSYFNITCLGCTAVGVNETDLLDINGTWIDYIAVDVTTVRALRTNVSFSNTSKWYSYLKALPPTFYLGDVFDQPIVPLGRALHKMFQHIRCLGLTEVDDFGTNFELEYRWPWRAQSWWRHQQSLLQSWWTIYCRQLEARDPRLSELWPCGGCNSVYTISSSSLIDSTYISVVMQDIKAYDFKIAGSTFYHVRWSGGRSSHVAIRQSLGVSIQLENHKSFRASFTLSSFFISSMVSCRHNATRVLFTNSYWSTSHNNYYTGGYFYNSEAIYDRPPPGFYKLLQNGGWCAVVQEYRRDGHCQSACDISERCVSL